MPVKLIWHRKRPPASDDDIRGVEARLGVEFPLDYRCPVMELHGASPDSPYLSFMDPMHGKMGTALAALLSFDQSDAESLIGTYHALADQLPMGLVPFADDPGGDYFCFDYRQRSHNPPIVYWHHERVGESAITPLAASFSDFLLMLRETPPTFD